MNRIALINDNQLLNQDYDFTKLFTKNEAPLGVGEFLVSETSPNSGNVEISAGNIPIPVVRSSVVGGFYALFNSTESQEISITGTNGYVGAIIARVHKDLINLPSTGLINPTGEATDTNNANIYYVEGTSGTALTDGAIDTALSNNYFWVRLANVEKHTTITNSQITDTRPTPVLNINNGSDESTIELDSNGDLKINGIIKININGDLENEENGIVKNNAPSKATPVLADSLLGIDSEDSNKIKEMTLTNLKPIIGTEKASDSEIQAGTNDSKFISPKGIEDNYGYSIVGGESFTFAQADTLENVGGTSYSLFKEIEITSIHKGSGTLRIKFDLDSSGNRTIYGRIYKNGIPVGTERVLTNTSWTTYSEDIAVTEGDLIQLYSKVNTPSGVLRNFRFYFSLDFNINSATINNG